jgi:hypothetical protein
VPNIAEIFTENAFDDIGPPVLLIVFELQIKIQKYVKHINKLFFAMKGVGVGNYGNRLFFKKSQNQKRIL